MTTSQQPRSAALPGEAAAAGDAHQRDETRQPAEEVEGEAVEAGHPDAVGVARPATAALGEEHDREPLALGHLEQPVLLPVVLQALGAGEDRVVVGHHHHRLPADGAGAADEPVGGRALDEVLELPTPSLGGDHQRAVLHEAARHRGGRRRSRGRCAGRCRRRRSTASGRAASRPTSWRARTSARSAPLAASATSTRHRGRDARAPTLRTASRSPGCTTSPAPGEHRLDVHRLGRVDGVLHLHRLDDHHRRPPAGDRIAHRRRPARRCPAAASGSRSRRRRSSHRPVLLAAEPGGRAGSLVGPCAGAPTWT